MDLSITTPEDTPVGVTLVASDPDGDPLSYAVSVPPAHGTLSGTGADRTYTPAAGFSGSDSFTWTVTDGRGGTVSSLVTFTVTPVNDTPAATGRSVSTDEDTPVDVTLAGSDPDGDAITYSVLDAPAHGTLSGTGKDLTYTPEAGYAGPDTFTFTVSDGHVTSAPATVTITVTPAPVPVCRSPKLDRAVDVNIKPGKAFTSPAISTAGGGRLLLAFIEADGPKAPVQSVRTVTGGGLDWKLVVRENSTWGTTEVWQAYATTAVSKAKVTATLASGGFGGSVTVAAFSDSATSVGAVGKAAGISRSLSATITPSSCGSLVWAAAHDWSRAVEPTLAAGQVFEHKYLDRHGRRHVLGAAPDERHQGGSAGDPGRRSEEGGPLDDRRSGDPRRHDHLAQVTPAARTESCHALRPRSSARSVPDVPPMYQANGEWRSAAVRSGQSRSALTRYDGVLPGSSLRSATGS